MDLVTRRQELADLKCSRRFYVGTASKGLKAEMAILTKRIDDLTKGKSEKGKIEKGKPDKGLIAKSFNWDDESVSLEDEGITKIKAFMTIAEDEPSVGKANTHILFCLSYYKASHRASYRAFH
ncbi:hypothetical protein Tco_0610898 [Tanacetum coccineum]